MTKYEKNILKQAFYDRNPEIVAKELLGKYLVRNDNGILLVGKIIETEAYLSAGDAAAHSFSGQNNRNKSLYKAAGHAYVHSMRQWYLLDVVTEQEGVPSSVLIRAIEPITGIETMKQYRKTDDLKNFANGPSKLCQAFNITKKQDGIDMTSRTSPLFISDSQQIIPGRSINISPRIGISKAADMPLRFSIETK